MEKNTIITGDITVEVDGALIKFDPSPFAHYLIQCRDYGINYAREAITNAINNSVQMLSDVSEDGLSVSTVKAICESLTELHNTLVHYEPGEVKIFKIADEI